MKQQVSPAVTVVALVVVIVLLAVVGYKQLGGGASRGTSGPTSGFASPGAMPHPSTSTGGMMSGGYSGGMSGGYSGGMSGGYMGSGGR